jgi:anti-anti-sigma factor
MTLRVCNVEIKQLPETLNVKQARHFLGEVESCMNTNRPCLVLDCSNVRQMDRSVIHLLLRCLEEAIKRNGDVKLTSLSEAGKATLRLTGVSRLFEMFETNADALSSFRRFSAEAALHITAPSEAYRPSQNAA